MTEACLTLSLAPAAMERLLPLFESGVTLPVQVNCSVRELLCGQLGIDPRYLDERIQTLFLNARAVDDVDRAMVTDAAVLALSAAMPGLVGATLRKSGGFASLRGIISDAKDSTGRRRQAGRVVLKLFNMVRNELGPVLLASGVVVGGGQLAAVFARHRDRLRTDVLAARCDGRPVAPDDLPDIAREVPLLRLRAAPA